MEWQLLDNIPFQLDEEAFFAEMHLKSGSGHIEPCRALCREAVAVAKPRALWLRHRVTALDENGMTVGGVRLDSPLFTSLLSEGQDIYPFLATAGQEISDWYTSYRDNMLHYYWADALAEKALRAAVNHIEAALATRLDTAHLAAFDPGSLLAWPIEQQGPLFEIFGTHSAACGVTLTPHYLMRPQKSVSGLYFSSEAEFYNCQLCPRLRCPSRRAEFTG